MSLRQQWHQRSDRWRAAICHFCQGCASAWESPAGAPRVGPAPVSVTAPHPRWTTAFKWLPVVDGGRCTGCGRCLEVCTPQCLAIAEGIALLMTPDQCGSDEHCVGVCREDAIRMEWTPAIRDIACGRWRM